VAVTVAVAAVAKEAVVEVVNPDFSVMTVLVLAVVVVVLAVKEV
jgi:uncharacterized membrane protein (DUF373 family)